MVVDHLAVLISDAVQVCTQTCKVIVIDQELEQLIHDRSPDPTSPFWVMGLQPSEKLALPHPEQASKSDPMLGTRPGARRLIGMFGTMPGTRRVIGMLGTMPGTRRSRRGSVVCSPGQVRLRSQQRDVVIILVYVMWCGHGGGRGDVIM